MSVSRCLAVPAGFLVMVLLGCSDRTIHVPSMDPDGAARQALAEYDTNKDGALSDDELDKCPGLKAGRAWLDTNKDKRLSADEITRRVRDYLDDRAGLLALVIQFTLDGKPLRDAEVTLVPESFLGSAVKPAQGKTNAGGACVQFRTEGAEFPGVHPGVFRIVVSKKDASGKELVPARYNTQTTLGIEARSGNPAVANGLELNLSSR
jgi:hypothetical protein